MCEIRQRLNCKALLARKRFDSLPEAGVSSVSSVLLVRCWLSADKTRGQRDLAAPARCEEWQVLGHLCKYISHTLLTRPTKLQAAKNMCCMFSLASARKKSCVCLPLPSGNRNFEMSLWIYAVPGKQNFVSCVCM